LRSLPGIGVPYARKSQMKSCFVIFEHMHQAHLNLWLNDTWSGC
jgi:hypothetical protein